MLKTILNRGTSLTKATASAVLDVASYMGNKFCQMAKSPRSATFMLLMLFGVVAFAQTGTSSPGETAMEQVISDISAYIPLVKKLCYTLAAIFAIVGAISVYIAMNNDEQDVKKKIMMTVGACIFMIAAAESLPLFFGSSTGTGTGN